ncbi:MAG: P-II family nitrogen regulator [Burkholderiales bacterium]|nr:P-II family nitrogen regulator [Burkholderiales bacterium]
MSMKEVRAIVRPSRLPRLRDALRAIPNFPGVTVWSADGFTAPAALVKRTVREELTEFSPKVLVCVLCEESMVHPIREAVFDACSTGTVGDGLVWVVDVQATHRVRDRAVVTSPPMTS